MLAFSHAGKTWPISNPSFSIKFDMHRKIIERGKQFLFEPAYPNALGFFRIAVSLVSIFQVGIMWPYLQQLYGNFGFIQWAVIETGTDTWLPSIGKLCLALQVFDTPSSSCVYGVFLFYLISLIGLLIGWKTRFFAIAAWISHALTVNSGYLSLYGVDTMIHISLFYCAWMPVGKNYSADSYLRKRDAPPSYLARLSIRTLQLHLCIIYLNTGLAKISGEQWWSGEAIWRAFMQPQFSAYDFSWLASVPYIAQVTAISVMFIEAGYAFFIWPSKTRPIWLSAIIALHFGIGVIMGLWMFSLMMIVMNFTAFGFDLISTSDGVRKFFDRALSLNREAAAS